MRSTLLRAILLPLLFLGTCSLLLRPAERQAAPMTYTTLDSLRGQPFPVLLMTGNMPRILLETDPRTSPVAPQGSSYLVPPSRVRETERWINDHEQPRPDGTWVLRVDELAPGRQRIELDHVNDGYAGSVYEATPTSIRPLQRRFTGPGFAFLVGGRAFVMNAVLWLAAWLVVRIVCARRRAGEMPSPS